MKTILAGMIVILGATQFTYSYEYDDFIKDSKSDPVKVFEHLHPDTIKVIKTAAERLRKDDAYRDSVFLGSDPSCDGKTDQEIWVILWNEFVGSDYYENAKLIDTVLTENKTMKLCIIEDTLYGETGRLFDVVSFKKNGDDYLLMMPETITVALYTGDL